MALQITQTRTLHIETLDREKNIPDKILFFAVLALLSLGVVMVFDASYPIAIECYNGDKAFFAKKQFLWAVIGLGGMLLAARIPFWKWQRLAAPLFATVMLSLAAVLVIGHGAQGAHRWLKFGPVQIQPSEFAKLLLVLYLAHILTRYPGLMRHFWHGLLPLLGVVTMMFFLVEREPDLGTAIVLLLTALTLFYAAGAKMRWIAGLLAFFIAAGVLLALHKGTDGYRWRRLTTFMSSDANLSDKLGDEYQITHSKIALGTGGLLGLGMGESREKRRGNLPAQRTDFIFAIIGEEFGLLGSLVFLVLFLIVAARGLHIAHRSKSRFGALVAVGVTAMITLQALINIGVVSAAMPATGVPLPFISYGGSSLVPTLFGIGILLNISANYGYIDPKPIRRRRENVSQKRIAG